MPQKRKSLNATNGKSKIARTDIGSIITCTEIVKDNSKSGLKRKGREYAELELENKNLASKKHEAMNKSIGNEIINLNQKLKDKEDKNRELEFFVKTLHVRVENQDAVVENLLQEIKSLERNENLLKTSLESLELDVKLANSIMMEKDDCITNLNNDLLNSIKEYSKLKESSKEEIMFYKQTIEALENKNASLETENEMFSKSLLNKDIELESLAKEHQDSKERIQSDLNEMTQENQDIKSIKKIKEAKITDLEQKQIQVENHVSESKEKIKLLEFDLDAKIHEIQNLESIHMAKWKKVNSIEQKHLEEMKQVRCNILELEKRCERLQNCLGDKEIDLIIFTKKHEIELEERKSTTDQLEGALLLANTKLKTIETLLEKTLIEFEKQKNKLILLENKFKEKTKLDDKNINVESAVAVITPTKSMTRKERRKEKKKETRKKKQKMK